MTRSRALWIGLAVSVVLVLCSPLLARMGSWRELTRWECPEPNPWGHAHPLYASIEESTSSFDPFGLYRSQRLLVTDGGYAYIVYFDVPSYPSKAWVEACEVRWDPSGVRLQSPSGLAIEVSKEAVLQQL